LYKSNFRNKMIIHSLRHRAFAVNKVGLALTPHTHIFSFNLVFFVQLNLTNKAIIHSLRHRAFAVKKVGLALTPPQK
jgi:hypothetical protein